jgi:hypothetical protein
VRATALLFIPNVIDLAHSDAVMDITVNIEPNTPLLQPGFDLPLR